MPNKLGSLHTGLAFNDLFSTQAETLIGSKYSLEWNSELSLLLKDFYDRVDFFASFAFLDPFYSKDALNPDRHYLKSFGVEIRPIPLFGLKLERTWRGYWTLGTIGRKVINDKYKIGAEINLSHDSFHKPDQGRGFLISLGLNLGM